MWFVSIIIDRRAWSWEVQDGWNWEEITMNNVQAASEAEAIEYGFQYVRDNYSQATIDNECVTVSTVEM